ncbi:retrovirus-related Pol polyprotein from transposon opus [Trichonephila clavipes]|nr:retrovirus-related Pol polyprotein from transposon opus [Trichonephila clavipes]
MDKRSMVADSFHSEQECCAELALVWKQAKEGKGNYYEVDGYLFHRDKILRESIGQLVVNMDLIGPIDLPSSKGHMYILCLDQHTRWGEAMPVTSLRAKVTCEALLSIFSKTEIYLLLKREGFVEKNSAVSWVMVLDLWKWYFCRSLTKNYAACFMSFGICMTKKVRFKIEYTSYGCNLTAQVLRMLEQFVVSRIVDIDILMQIWKNRIKQINFVLEWVRWVGSEIIPAKGKLEP